MDNETMNEIKEDIKKKWYKSKTIILNLLVSAPLLLNELLSNAEVMSFLQSVDKKYYIYAIILNNIINIYLRTKTDSKVVK